MTTRKPRRATFAISRTVQTMAAFGLILCTMIAVAGLVYGLVFNSNSRTDSLTSVATGGIGALAVLSGAKRESDE